MSKLVATVCFHFCSAALGFSIGAKHWSWPIWLTLLVGFYMLSNGAKQASEDPDAHIADDEEYLKAKQARAKWLNDIDADEYMKQVRPPVSDTKNNEGE